MLTTLGGIFDLDTVKVEIKALEKEMLLKDFWNNQEHAQSVSKEFAKLTEEVAVWEGINSEIKELKEMAELYYNQGDDSVSEDVLIQLLDLTKRFEKMEFATLFAADYDKENAIVSIHAGSGGTEAQDWTQMLLRMYVRFAEDKNWKVTILSESRADDVGLKSVTLKVAGRYAYGYFRSEAGVHRLVRISPFDAEKMRHTTFALVETLPELEDVADLELNTKDLRIDTFLASGHGGQSVNTTYSAVRIVHIPTGTTVSCQNERSQQQNKETALKILKSKLHQIKLKERDEQKKQLRGEYHSAEWGNQIRSYVMHPYKMVKDHRTNFETADVQAVLDGDLTDFVEAYLKKELENSDRFEQANKDI